MKSLFAWLVLAGLVYGGEEVSVLTPETTPAPTPVQEPVKAVAPVASTPVQVAPAPTVVVVNAGCKNGCCGNNCDPVYNEKVDEKSTCRRTLFGRVVRRDVKRTVLTPVR